MTAAQSPADLEEAAGGIRYRIDQMMGSARLLALCVLVPHPVVVRNALIESFLINARVVAYFLTKKPGKEVVAGDFCQTWTPVAGLGSTIGRISDHLTHAKHIAPPELWELDRIARPLIDGLRALVQEISNSASERADWFAAVVDDADALLGHRPSERPDDGGSTATTN